MRAVAELARERSSWRSALRPSIGCCRKHPGSVTADRHGGRRRRFAAAFRSVRMPTGMRRRRGVNAGPKRHICGGLKLHTS
jgi:hypothetical protein